VYVQPYPAMNRKWQISTGGGSQPRWSPRQDELLYRGEGALMSVRISTTPTFVAERPQKLFADRFTDAGSTRTAYDVGPDAKQILMIREVQDANYNIAPQVNVVLNWLGELRGLR